MAIWTFVLLIIVGCVSTAQSYAADPFVGFITDDGVYQLRFDFGIEQWEQEKLTNHRLQQWILRCSYPVATTVHSTRCDLERLVIDKKLTPSSGDIINQHWHSVSDGTLKLVNVDWPKGVLDFTVVHTDQSTIEVMLRIKVTEKSLYLKSFKATGIARGFLSNSLTAIEYRIPKYTYMLNVPVEMNGLQPMADKEWDDLLTTLSKEDQKRWEDFRANLKDCSTRKEETKQPGSPTVTEQINLMVDDLVKCLSKSKLSVTAQKKIVDLLRKQLISGP